MKRTAIMLAWLACVGMLSPVAVFGDQPQAQNPNRIYDVALASGGALHGQVVDQQGNAVVNAAVAIQGQAASLQTTTDQNGRFVASLEGGVYQIAAAGSVSAVRAWSENTAPPVATKGILVVSDVNVVRGQCNSCNSGGAVMGPPMQGGYASGPPMGDCGGGCYDGSCGGAPGCGTTGGGFLGLISNPWVVGAVVAAAIAIPLALDDDDNAS